MTGVRVVIPDGADPREVWAAHIRASLLAQQCPRCGGEMLDGSPYRAGWYRCRWNSYPDGWWRSDEDGWAWQLGINPHTGEYEWRD